MKNETKWFRYHVKNPTDIYGHYTYKAFSDLKTASQHLKSGGFILDAFKPIGYGYKIVKSA
jgi:hypothetical protein